MRVEGQRGRLDLYLKRLFRRGVEGSDKSGQLQVGAAPALGVPALSLDTVTARATDRLLDVQFLGAGVWAGRGPQAPRSQQLQLGDLPATACQPGVAQS